MTKDSWITKLKKKWNIKGNLDFFLILLVFSLAGITITVERPIIFNILGIQNSPLWLKILVYIPLVFPLYQINLLVFGFLLGQFDFFLEKEKNLLRFLTRALGGKTHSKT